MDSVDVYPIIFKRKISSENISYFWFEVLVITETARIADSSTNN